MKNIRKIWHVTAITAITYISAAFPVYAGTSCIISDNMTGSLDDPYFWEIFDAAPTDPGAVSYIIDFFDDDGSILDSKICQYAERLEDIKIPGEREDEQYIYRFLGWSPQLSETVTECMAYTALYQKIDKNDPAGEHTVSGSEVPETESPIIKAGSDSLSPDETTQVSSTSYDVTPFHIVTPAADPKIPEIPDIQEILETPYAEKGIPIPENTSPKDDGYASPDRIPDADIPSLPAAVIYQDPINTTETPALTDTADIPTMDPAQDNTYLFLGEAQPITMRDTKTRTSRRIPSKTADMTLKEGTDRPDQPVIPAADKGSLTPAAGHDRKHNRKRDRKYSRQIPQTRSTFPLFLSGIAACGGTIWLKRQRRDHL